MEKKKAIIPTAPILSKDLQEMSLSILDEEDSYEGLFVTDSNLDRTRTRLITMEDLHFQRVSWRNADIHQAKSIDVKFENCDFSNIQWV